MVRVLRCSAIQVMEKGEGPDRKRAKESLWY